LAKRAKDKSCRRNEREKAQWLDKEKKRIRSSRQRKEKAFLRSHPEKSEENEKCDEEEGGEEEGIG